MNTGIKITAIILAVVVVILLGLLIFIPSAKEPMTGSAPAQQFVTSPDVHVAVSLPHASDVITSPAAIEGTVVNGSWFFEGSFPIKIVDADGTVLGQGTAQALGDWTSTGTVPFSASIPFTAPHSATGTIVFSKDNPSGAAANAESFSVEVRFQ